MRKGRAVRNLVESTTVQSWSGSLLSWNDSWEFLVISENDGHKIEYSADSAVLFTGVVKVLFVTRKTGNCQHILDHAELGLSSTRSLRMVFNSCGVYKGCEEPSAGWEPKPTQPGTPGAGLAADMHLPKRYLSLQLLFYSKNNLVLSHSLKCYQKKIQVGWKKCSLGTSLEEAAG